MPVMDPGPLQVERLPDGRRQLLRVFNYEVDGVEEPISVPAAFVTDFSSDPIGLLDWSKVDVAGVVHDYLYQHPKEIGSRWREDVIWLKIATSGEWRVNRFFGILGFLGIRIFGWIFRKGARQLLRKVIGVLLGLAGLGSAVYEIITCFRHLLAGSVADVTQVLTVAFCLSVLVPASIRVLLSSWRSWQRS